MENKKIKRVMLFLLPMLLASCGGGSSSEGRLTIVKMSLMNSVNENAGWLAMIDAANEVLADDNIKIEPDIIQTDEWDKYYTKVASNMAGGIGGTIGRIAESHIPLMIKRNQLQDLSEVYNSLDMDDYVESAFGGVAYSNGKYYGMPTGIQHMVLYYNKDYFDAYNAGKDASLQINYPSSDWNNPATFEQIRDMAAKLSSGSRPNRDFGFSAGPYLAYAGMYAKSAGGDNVFNSSGNSAIKSEPFYKVYDWFDSMIQTDNSMPKPSDTSIETAMDKFQAGNMAMIVDGAWWMGDMTNEKLVQFNVGVAATPTGIEGQSSYSSEFTDCFFAVRNSRTPVQDKKAIKALLSQEAVAALSATGVGGIPVRRDALSTYENALDEKFTASDVQCFVDGLDHGLHVPYTTYYNSVDQIINQKMSVWLSGQMTAHNFVDFMDQTMQEAIDNDN
jgi:ABC-type glycerol-3-phosphate transport system substrate-binding protein